MYSLRSPLHIPFTYQVVCAPVGAHHLPFTCFASHTTLNPHLQLFHPPKPLLWCSLNSHSFLLGVCRCLLFLLACGSLRADRAVMLFAVNPCLQSLHSSLSFLFPFIQPLSAPHTRVAHSLHSTSRHSSIPQSVCYAFN